MKSSTSAGYDSSSTPGRSWRVEVVEAEVLWGGEVRERVKGLRQCILKLQMSVRQMLRIRRDAERRGGRAPRASDIARLERAEEVVYRASEDPEEDPFGKLVDQAVSGVEEMVRPRLAP